MKKLIAILISAVMIFAMAATVFAEPAPAEVPAAQAETVSQVEEPTVVELNLNEQDISGMKVSAFSTNNSDTSRTQDEGHIYVGYAVTDGTLDADNSNWGDKETFNNQIILNDKVTGEGFTAIRAEGETEITATGTLILQDGSDGQIASDFTGVGAAITEAKGATVYVSDMAYYSEGFVRAFAIVQDSTLVVTNSDITALGKDPLVYAWDGYYNSANTSMMISPPWVLGIQGGIRTMNVLGAGSTLVVADSTITAGGWGVLSTDGCTNPYLYLYDSSLDILPESAGGMNSGWAILGYDEDAYGSGYGTYLIGGAQEYFRGVYINGATYASILTGGDGYYEGLVKGEVYEAVAEDGTVVGTYTAKETLPTIINTVFGFMAHNSGSINVGNNTLVNSAECNFLYKSADSTWNVDGAKLMPGNGIIFQMIDNDDSTVGGFNPFGTYLIEEAGFPTEAASSADNYAFTTDTEVDSTKTYYSADTEAESGYVVVENPTQEGLVAYYEKSSSGNKAILNFANGNYSGDVYNATGYYNQAPDTLTVDIAETATLTGDIALASHVHGLWLNNRSVDDVIAAIEAANAYHINIGGYYEGLEDIEYVFLDETGAVTEDKAAAVAIQFTKFSTAEYYLLGHVLNMIHYNGESSIDVTVKGTWKPEEASLVTYLKIAEGAHVFGQIQELDDGSILVTPSDEEAAAGEYGSEFIYIENPNAGGPGGGPGGPGGPGSEGGESPEGESPAEPAPEG